MKKLGIASQLHHKGGNYSGPAPLPEISIESLNINYTISNRGNSEPGSWDAWNAYFNRVLKRLVASGAELIVIASVTPHARLKEITLEIDVPVLSVYEAIGAYCCQKRIKKLLVPGTMPTMTSHSFQSAMTPVGVEVVFPPTAELKAAVVRIIDQLYHNRTDGAAEAIEQLVKDIVSGSDLQDCAVCLGCTELPLAFPAHSRSSSFLSNDVHYLNASVIHAAYAFQACIGSH